MFNQTVIYASFFVFLGYYKGIFVSINFLLLYVRLCVHLYQSISIIVRVVSNGPGDLGSIPG